MTLDLTDDDLDEMVGSGTLTHLTFVRAGLELQRRRAAERTVPPLIDAAIDRYANHGLPPGEFLRAVLEGNLFRAFACAAPDTLPAMAAIVTAVTTRLHSSTWGSPAAVAQYLEQMRLRSTR